MKHTSIGFVTCISAHAGDSFRLYNDYRVVDTRLDEYLLRSKNMNIWVRTIFFSAPVFINPIKDIVFLGKTDEKYTNGEVYTVFVKDSDGYKIIDDNGEYAYIKNPKIKSFKNASDYTPADLEKFTQELERKEKLLETEREQRNIADRKAEERRRQEYMAKQQVALETRKKTFFPALNFLIVSLGIMCSVFDMFNVYMFALLLSTSLGINVCSIHDVLKDKNPTNTGGTPTQKADITLLKLLKPATVLKIKNIEYKANSLKQKDFVSKVWLDTILELICLTIQTSLYEGKIIDSCEDYIVQFLIACEEHLDEASKGSDYCEEQIKADLATKAQKVITEKTTILSSLTTMNPYKHVEPSPIKHIEEHLG